MSKKRKIPTQNLIGHAIVLVLLILAIDFFLPLGRGIGTLYIIPILVAIKQKKNFIISLAIISSLFAFGILLFKDFDLSYTHVLINRTISFFAIWITTYIAVSHNILDQKMHYLQEIEQKNHELEQFNYAASHDLMEPLATIVTCSELILAKQEEKDDPILKQEINIIINTADHMGVLIRYLLEYSRLGKDLIIEAVDCNAILEEVKSDIGALISETHASISADNLPVIISVKTEIKQLFQNLISNAIKFRKKDEAPLIKILVSRDGQVWKFGFRDSGIGIDEQFHESIFTIFNRVYQSSQYEGTGIGLALCKKIVELHGGSIWVKSKINEGCTFYFTLKNR